MRGIYNIEFHLKKAMPDYQAHAIIFSYIVQGGDLQDITKHGR